MLPPVESPQEIAADIIRRLVARPAGLQVGALEKGSSEHKDILQGLVLAGLIDLDVQRHRWTSYCSLLIHEGRSLAYVAASMGNSARVISDHYLHVLRAAELGMRRSLVDAVYEARQSLQRTPDVRYVCSTPGRRHLRLVS